ncbi:WD repeat protein [Talaromyces stipitatus ATCC 10500]|uniref:WD repeat protein n=1 Tax=Talaromyces stipitatus (strain ATCC 10500 / CBS 375.48 / QM 6759 / NRRL 1006) TaxID=441959 RepID=B8M6G1_TALSN|nr:WD repeat protein [Talaromyces stipitatus ATCC 10500]EED19336.1 WD repeat protein [Talaromyces stipitatus ATCC 10500]
MSSPADSRAPTSAFESPTFGEDSSFHVEQPVGSASISPCGRDVVLASREGLHIIDLDSPYSPPRYLPHHTPWEVADVQWSPFAHRDSWVVSTSNQKALVWNLSMRSWENSIEYVLHAHSRAITDINFSAHHAEILATCAVDSFVHCWDLRIPSRPVVSFSDWFAGATQVKWNRQDPHIIASSHDKYLRIWDDRMGAIPLKSIEAHSTKIYGVDWERTRREGIVTCSLDKTIKIWNFEGKTDVPEKVIETPFPVWRARNTPFGCGILAMPQRGDNDLHLYGLSSAADNQSAHTMPLVHSFPGHKGQVKEFLWRPRGTVVNGIDQREFQLVSWGADRELRLHRVDKDILRGVGYEKGKTVDHSLRLTRLGATYRTFRDEPVENLDDSLYAETVISASTRPQAGAAFGSNNVSTRYPRASNHKIHIEPRIGMQGRSQFRANTSPIAWMRGVKISVWDIETLGDEITHVGEKFSKVDFESVDVRQRKVTISLHGPWGAEGSSLFLKLDIKFPEDYPRVATPTFKIQKTSAMTNELSEKIVSELRTISETYMSRKRGCLEGALRYLLGECSLEESIALVLGENIDTIKSPIAGLEDDESSDEDEDVGQFEKQDLSMSSELLRPVNANVMVPVAKVCGATWSHDGRLVCFFPPKKDKAGSLFESLGFKDISRLTRNDRVFEGFGRLHTSSPSRLPSRKTLGTMSTTDDGSSDYSDDSDTASSSSSDSSGMILGLPNRYQNASMWRSVGTLGTYRTRSADNSQLSTVGGPAATIGTVKSSDSAHNIISIHDLSDLLPTKKTLASQYQIFGRGAEVCAHNAAVAADSGYHHLAQVWGLLKLVLQNQSDLRPHNLDMDVLAGRLSHAHIHTHPGHTTDGPVKTKQPHRGALHRPSFSNSAFGGRWLINALFDHFERIGDIQMLAMLSCILHEQSLRTRLGRRRDKEVSFSQQAHNPIALDFFSSRVPDSKSQAATPMTSYSRDSVNVSALQSPEIPTEQWNSIGTTPHSSSASPIATHSRLLGGRKTPALSISASPDDHSTSRLGSGVGTALASSLSRSFTFGPSATSSPPAGTTKKKTSPIGSMNIPAAVTWGASQLINRAVSAIPEYLNSSTVITSRSHSEADSEKKKEARKPIKVHVSHKNRTAFDSDDSPGSPFIDRRREALFQTYRNSYANLLFVWDLPIQRSEVLKIGACIEQNRTTKQPSSFERGDRKDTTSSRQITDETLDVQRHCTECGHALYRSVFSSVRPEDLSGKMVKPPLPRCPSCSAVQPLSAHVGCVICGEVVSGMFIPCLECGHVCCFECHQAWFSLQQPRTGEAQNLSDLVCPSACGCSCTEHSETVVMPSPIATPTYDEKGNLVGAHHRLRPEMPPRSRQSVMAGQTDDDLDAWRGGANFARGLGSGLSRVLTATANERRRRTSSSNRKPQFDRIETM